jgi:hypothetical protein
MPGLRCAGGAEVEFVRFVDVQRVIGALDDVNRPHHDDDAIVASSFSNPFS